VEQASIRGALIALAVPADPKPTIHLLRVDEGEILVQKSCTVEGEITCLGLCSYDQQPWIVAGVWFHGQSWLAIYRINDPDAAPPRMLQLDQGRYDMASTMCLGESVANRLCSYCRWRPESSCVWWFHRWFIFG
jgi:hypothetical protein